MRPEETMAILGAIYDALMFQYNEFLHHVRDPQQRAMFSFDDRRVGELLQQSPIFRNPQLRAAIGPRLATAVSRCDEICSTG